MKIEPQDSINRVFPVEPAPTPARPAGQDETVPPVARAAEAELRPQARQVRRGIGRKSSKAAPRVFEEELEDVIDPTPRNSRNPWLPSK